MSAETVEGYTPENTEGEIVELFPGLEIDDEKRLRIENRQRALRERMGKICRQRALIEAAYLECISSIVTGDQELREAGGDPDIIKREYLSSVSPTSAIADYGQTHIV